MYDMTQPGMIFGSGSGFGGLAHTGLAAFNAYGQGMDWMEAMRKMQMQQQLDQFSQPAKLAQMQNQFQQNALGAQQVSDSQIGYYAARQQDATQPAQNNTGHAPAQQFDTVNSFGGHQPMPQMQAPPNPQHALQYQQTMPQMQAPPNPQHAPQHAADPYAAAQVSQIMAKQPQQQPYRQAGAGYYHGTMR
jgi:hypothetical protein